MNKNTKGFSIIEVLIVIIIISFISIASWMVYSRSKTQDYSAPPVPLQEITDDNRPNIESATESTPGYKTFSKEGISFEYPQDWTMNEFGQSLTSPDFKSEMDNRHGSTNIISGASISIQYPTSSGNYARTIDNYENWIGDTFSGYKGNEVIITIKNKKMIRFPSSYRHAEIENFGFDGQETIYFPTESLPASVGLLYKIGDDKSKYDGTYQHLLKTLEYN